MTQPIQPDAKENITIDLLEIIPDAIKQHLYKGKKRKRKIEIDKSEFRILIETFIISIQNKRNFISAIPHDIKVSVYRESTQALEGLFEPQEYFELLDSNYTIIHGNKKNPAVLKKHFQSLNLEDSQLYFLLLTLSYLVTEAKKKDNDFAYAEVFIESELKRLGETIEDSGNQKSIDNLISKENYTLNEAAEYLSISESYLYKLTSRGEIRHSKPGGKLVYFKKEDLDDYLERNPIRTTSEVRNNANTQAVFPRKRNKK